MLLLLDDDDGTGIGGNTKAAIKVEDSGQRRHPRKEPARPEAFRMDPVDLALTSPSGPFFQ